MKSFVFSLLLFFSLQLHAQTDPPEWRLSGLINLPDLKRAFFESGKVTVVLAEGKTERPFGNDIQLVRMDFKKETAEICTNKIFATLNLNFQGQSNSAEAEPTIIFERGNFDVVLDFYSTLLGRTLLRYPRLPETEFTFSARAQDRGEAIRAIEKELAEKGMTLILDGDTFAMLVPTEISSKIRAKSVKRPEPKSVRDISYNFPNTPFLQATGIYAALFGCKVEEDEPLPPMGTSIKLRTEKGSKRGQS